MNQISPVTQIAMMIEYYTRRTDNFYHDGEGHSKIYHHHAIEAPHMLSEDVVFMKANGWKFDYLNEKTWSK